MREDAARRIATVLAVAGPVLLAVNEPPSPTLLNQCASLGLTGLWVAAIGARCGNPSLREIASLLGATTLIIGGIVWSLAIALPFSIATGLWATVFASAILACAGNAAGRCGNAPTWYADFAWALCLAGVINAAIGCVQVFAPQWPDGDWMARSGVPGIAVGNLRQPNHLATLTLWSLVSTVALHELGALRRWPATAIAAMCMLGLVLSGSRTGIVGVILLASWGILDSRLSRPGRWMLWAMPIGFLALWLAIAAWAHASAHTFGSEGRLLAASGDLSSSRFAIWSNTLAMIVREPWSGVGFGEFNVAWTLTAFPDRPIAFFDHTHNLPLQLLAEIGIPLGLLVVVLFLVAMAQTWKRAWASDGQLGVAKRSAFMLVLTIGLHSLLEYPLWYAYFLLPTAFAWGFGLSRSSDGAALSGIPATDSSSVQALSNIRALVIAGLIVSMGAIAAVLDYHNVVVIYAPPEDAAPLEERIARGQRSLLFGHHADYAAATAFGEPKAPLSPSQQLAFRRAPHQLLDVRLMIAWSQALAAEGDLDKARWLAARIREFRNPGADEYFEPCNNPAEAARAFQCQPPQREINWREFVQKR